MKIYQTLLRQKADNYVATTYNVDLPFFEYMLFDKLYGNGCRNITVVCDPNQYQLALEDVTALNYLGQRYLCMPCTAASSVFHSKLTLLTSSEGGLLLLGSNNVSRPGLMRNLEVVTRFEHTTNDPDESARAVCRWAYDYLLELAEIERNPNLHESLDQLWGTTEWMRTERERAIAHGCWPLHNLRRPLLDQLVEHWREHDGSQVREAVVVSPYYDKEAGAFAALLRELEPRTVSLITQYEAPGLDPGKVRGLLNEAGIEWSARQPETDSRRLHAKVLALNTERGSWLLSGSPNFSRPALLCSAQDGNAEVAVLRYEPDPNYLRPFFAPVLEPSCELDLDWHTPEQPESDPDSPPSPAYYLARADFENTQLSVVVEPALPDSAALRMELSGPDADLREEVEWRRDGHTITLGVSEEASVLFEKPASIQLVVELSGTKSRSTLAVVNNRNALRDSRQPSRSRSRDRIPVNLVPESFEQALDLMDTLYRLLAMNTEQLRGHRGISQRAAKDLEREDALAVEDEDYDPQQMIVDEELRPAYGSKGAVLYEDYYDRLTYEDLLRAARAVTYRPEPSTRSESVEGPTDEPPADPLTTRIPLECKLGREDASKRIAKRFARLVANFELGVQDGAYMSQVPPTYLRENFVVLTTLLRVFWLNGMVDNGTFLRLSERLFVAFFGDGQQPGARAILNQRTRFDEYMTDEDRLRLREKSWLHLYLMADLALVHAEDVLPDLAVLLRRAAGEMAPPSILSELTPELLAEMWGHSFSYDREPAPDALELVADLKEYSEWYNETTICRELARSLRGAVRIEPVNVKSGMVRCLRIDAPWKHEDLDMYWKAFVNFCRWPEPKKNARLEAYDTNLRLGGYDSRRLTIFYETSRNKLGIWTNLNGNGASRTIDGVPLQALVRIGGFSEIWNHNLP